MKQLNTPILFLIFNRPDTTERVFEEIRKAKPKRLFVVADGPRNEEEREKCKAARAVVEKIDWDCEVKKNYSDKNLGCKIRVSSGIDWFFKNVEQGIILEDDCLPSQSFFRFCEELLEKYKDDKRVMMISGDNFQFGKNKAPHDYYFSRKFFHIWGWATWRRAWKHYDVDMKKWPEAKSNKILDGIFEDEAEKNRQIKIFEKVYAGEIDTWDSQWVFTCIKNKGFSIVPNKNLISNIGFDKRATHTTNESNLANIPTGEILFPMKHPEYFITPMDNLAFEELLKKRKINRIMNKIKKTKKMFYEKGLFYTLRHAVKRSYQLILKEKIEKIKYKYYKQKRKGKKFIFQGKEYFYFSHPYNSTWENGRAIEIPIIKEILDRNTGKDILEVGNVLSHYFETQHDIVDKYEKGNKVNNADIVNYSPDKQYDLIISISTIEHVGWDEEPKEPAKILKAIKNLKNLLKNKGQVFLTLPLGYNHFMDKLIEKKEIGFSKIFFLKRIDKNNNWVEVDSKDTAKAKYNYPFKNANIIAIAIIEK